MTACPTLPSAIAANDLLDGKPGSLAAVGWSFAQRSLIIAAALYLAGERQRVGRYALAGAALIEAFVLIEIARQRSQ